MTSGGSLASLETAARFPVRLVESGPAGGAILAGRIALERGERRILSFDMGGTTAKICLIDDGEPLKGARVRGRPPVALQEGQRHARAHPHHRDGGDRRRRRLDCARRRPAAHPGRARQRRRRAGPGLLRPRRHRADRDGRRPGDRQDRRGALRRRQDRRSMRRKAERALAVGASAPSSPAWRPSRPPSASPRSSTRTWPTPRACTRWSAAWRSPSARWWRSAARRRCTRAGWPRSSASRASSCRRMPASARRSASWRRRRPTRSCARATCGSTPSMRRRANALVDAMQREAVAHARAAAGERPVLVRRSAFMRYAGQGHEITIALPEPHAGGGRCGHVPGRVRARVRAAVRPPHSQRRRSRS